MKPTRRRRREQDGWFVTTRGNRRLTMVNAASCSAELGGHAARRKQQG
jgi:hypothetical protein